MELLKHYFLDVAYMKVQPIAVLKGWLRTQPNTFVEQLADFKIFFISQEAPLHCKCALVSTMESEAW